jgi:hypothetical protein
MAGRVKVRRRQLEARSWTARGGQTRWDSTAVRMGSVGMGWERELMGGAPALVRGERGDAEDGKHESKRKLYS